MMSPQDRYAAITQLIKAGRYDEAERALIQSRVECGDAAWICKGLGILYRATKRMLAAESSYRRGVLLAPNDPEMLSNFGSVLVATQQFETALPLLLRAVELAPLHLDLRRNLAAAYFQCSRYEDSLAVYRECLQLDSNDHTSRLATGFLALQLGDLDSGWRDYEVRHHDHADHHQFSALPVWNGEDLAGKRLLLLDEQGHGDTIMAARFIALLSEQCHSLTLCCRPPLHDLFAQLPCRLASRESINTSSFDYRSFLLSVPRLIEPDWSHWPPPANLHVSAQASAKYQFLGDDAPNRLKVGIAWSGSPLYHANEQRSAAFEWFLQLSCDLPEIQFYSFQKGGDERKLGECGAGAILPLGQSFGGFEDSAAAAQQMDCLVMTDSAYAHLAGSLNVPVLNLLHRNAYWAYRGAETTTTLYPSLRLIRQSCLGDWTDVMQRVSVILRQLACARSQQKLSASTLLDITDRTGIDPSRPAT